MTEIEHYMDKVTEIAAERDKAYATAHLFHDLGTIAAAERDALQVEVADLKSEVTALSSDFDDVWSEKDAHDRGRVKAEAKADALQALVNDLAASVGAYGHDRDLHARLDAAAKADQ